MRPAILIEAIFNMQLINSEIHLGEKKHIKFHAAKLPLQTLV